MKLTKPPAKRMTGRKTRATRLRTVFYRCILDYIICSECHSRFCLGGVRYRCLRVMPQGNPSFRRMDVGCWNAFMYNICLTWYMPLQLAWPSRAISHAGYSSCKIYDAISLAAQFSVVSTTKYQWPKNDAQGCHDLAWWDWVRILICFRTIRCGALQTSFFGSQIEGAGRTDFSVAKSYSAAELHIFAPHHTRKQKPLYRDNLYNIHDHVYVIYCQKVNEQL